jgi:hypothetical protein
MGLYLCVFADDATDEELQGVEVGGYDDFNLLRQAVADRLELAGWGSRFPVLMLHPDSDGTWSPQEASHLEAELLTIAGEFERLPPVAFPLGWQETVAKQLGLQPVSLLQCFIDVDGEPLVDRLIGLCREAQRIRRDIWFQ